MIRTLRRCLVLVLGGTLIAGALAACSATDEQESHLVVMLDWAPGPNASALYWGLDHGSFLDHGVNVDVEIPSETTAPAKLISTGAVDLAFSYEATAIQAEEQGLDVIAVGSVLPNGVAGMLAPASSGVQAVTDLVGKKVGYSGIPVYKAYIDQMLEHSGISTNSVEIVNTGFNDVPALLSGQVQATGDGFYPNQRLKVELEEGKAPFFVRNTDLGVPAYNEVVFLASKSRLLADHTYRDMLKAFLSVYYKAVADASNDPAAAFEILKDFSESEHIYLKKSVELTLAEMTGAAEASSTSAGCMNLADWQAYADWMLTRDLINSEISISDSNLATNELLPFECSPGQGGE